MHEPPTQMDEESERKRSAEIQIWKRNPTENKEEKKTSCNFIKLENIYSSIAFQVMRKYLHLIASK